MLGGFFALLDHEKILAVQALKEEERAEAEEHDHFYIPTLDNGYNDSLCFGNIHSANEAQWFTQANDN